MKKKNKRITIVVTGVVLLIVVLSLLFGANYLIDYALKPGERSRNEKLAWTEIEELYPGMEAWRDSLKRNGALHDTVIMRKGVNLHAWYVKAPRPTAATALLVHGYTDCSIRMMPLGRMYNRDLKMNILLPDLQNAGRTDGDHFQMGWLDREDVKEWARVSRTLFGDTARVVVHGVSMGAATTMMLSGDKDVPRCVKAYVEDCGYTSVEEQFSKELKERFGLPAWPLIPLASQLCEWRYGWNFEEASSLKQVAQCSLPMFFIHGTADSFVPTRMVYPLYKAKPQPKALWLAPGAAHARSYHAYPKAYTWRVKRFLIQYKVLYK